ncbi:lipopolysaccharide assembly protein LapA domain-containing protein [Thermodesulfobacteriota bacterium]
MLRNIMFIALIAVVLIFVIQNTQVVEFRFLAWTISMSRALMLFGALAIGVVAGWLLRVPKQKNEQQGNGKRKK